MKIGMVGMGKLGLPVSLAIESKGHEVYGCDKSLDVYRSLLERKIPYKEEGLQPLLDSHNIHMMDTVGQVVANSEIIFLPIQTPHDPKYEGTTRIPDDRKDFDYTYLEEALKTVAGEAGKLGVKKTVAVISTCLPGTYEERLKQLTNEHVDYVYTPQFIAMGTVLEDYLNPEFNLIGVESEEAADKLEEFYATINDAPNIRTDITTAEGIKVSYNTWITAKTVIANAWGELAHKTGMNFDDIKKAWDVSDKRIHSPRYTNAGMSDGGGCHPRDNIALSYIADKVGMSHNIWDDLMAAREDYEQWHAEMIAELSDHYGLPVTILGRAFKPETNIETGSPSILVSNLLNEMGVEHIHSEKHESWEPSVYFIGTKHKIYEGYSFPEGSVVIDPFGIIEDKNGVEVIRLGRK